MFLVISLSILGRFGCSIPCFEGFHMVYQMTGHHQSQRLQELPWLQSFTSHNQSCDLTCKHYRRLTLQVLNKLQENNLFVNLDKCTFKAKEVDYLGMIICKNQIKMDPAKLEEIRNWPTPTTVKQIWSFLGFRNFYRKFIRHYADIAWPLNDLTKKDLIWNWTDACQEAFEKLKEEFQKAPVLLMPDSTKLFIIESDASKFATGAVIWQKDMNGDYHSCGYISHSFGATQQNYEIYDQELMGIVCTLETWQHYLQWSPFPTVILSDHKNFTYFRTIQKLNRWLLWNDIKPLSYLLHLIIVWSCGHYYKVQGWTHVGHMVNTLISFHSIHNATYTCLSFYLLCITVQSLIATICCCAMPHL